ncbi:hypothetical protein RT94_22670 [Pseudomonas viridiflava]|nr:hypothetical protein RT94_22670 [Pseudomonas viridiflava]
MIGGKKIDDGVSIFDLCLGQQQIIVLNNNARHGALNFRRQMAFLVKALHIRPSRRRAGGQSIKRIVAITAEHCVRGECHVEPSKSNRRSASCKSGTGDTCQNC